MRSTRTTPTRASRALAASVIVTMMLATPRLAFAGAACVGDTDDSGIVDIDDIVNVVLDFGTDGAAHGGDVNGSGLVDIDDIVQVVLAFGPCPPLPECAGTDSPYLTITYDGMASFVPFTGTPAGSGFVTWGLAAIDDAGTLVMHSDAQLWLSLDDGCTWTSIAATDPFGLYRVTPGPNRSAFAWVDNGTGSGPMAGIYHVRNAPAGSDSFVVAFRAAPVSAMHGFGVDPVNGAHVRTANDEGLIYESFNAGASWSPIGVAASPGGGFLSYVIEFDPNDLDHAVYGRSNAGAFVTFDGGATWTPSTGLTSTREHGSNFFSAAISPVNGLHVLGMAIDLGETFFPDQPPPPPSQGRHMYLSTDGGLTWTPVLSQGTGGGEPGEGVFMQNQPLIRASRTDANEFHYLFSVSPAFGGTTVYRYEVGVPGWTSVHSDTVPKVRVFERSRVNPDGLLLGFGL